MSAARKIIQEGLIGRLTRATWTSTSAKYSNLTEPDYLKLLKGTSPLYPDINIQIKGYDFAVLERFHKEINCIASLMNLNVTRNWAQEHKKIKVTRKAQNNIVEAEYILKMYERNMQVIDMTDANMSLFLELASTCCPPGVFLKAHQHLPEHDEIRYVPNYRVLELKESINRSFKTKK